MTDQLGAWRRTSVLAILMAVTYCSPRLRSHTESPEPRNTLVRRLENPIRTLNPICAYDPAGRLLANYLFTPLVSLDNRSQASPGIAASWQISDNHLRYRFALTSATFSDGTRVRASDVLFTLRKIQDPASESHIANLFEDLDLSQTSVIDEKTIEVVFRRAIATQLSRFAQVYVLPEHVYANGDFRNDFNVTAVGSGPYRLVSGISGTTIVLERRDDYWKEQPPIRSVIFTVILDYGTAWTALTDGRIDESYVPSVTWQSEHTNPRWKDRLAFLSFYTPTYNFIAWNERNPVLHDKRIRRALGMAVPVQTLVSALYHDNARRLSGPFTPDEDAYSSAVPQLPYAPGRARRLLADAGWRDRDNDGVLEKDGKRFKISLQISPGPHSEQFAEVVQSEFKRIGVQLEIDVIDLAGGMQNILQGNYDAAYLTWSLDTDSDLYSIFHSSQVPPRGRNFVFYANAEVDGLIEKARMEFDPWKRRQLHNRLHALLAEDQPYTWIVQPAAGWAVTKRVQNAYPASASEYRLWAPASFGWWIDPGSPPWPASEEPSFAPKPTGVSSGYAQTIDWIDTLSTEYERKAKQPWFWLVSGVGALVGTYVLGIAAILLLAWSRGSRFVARSRLRKAALAPLRILPAFARWVLLIGYKRHLTGRTSFAAAPTYFGLPAALDDGTQIFGDMSGAQLHSAVAASVAPQRPLFIIGPGGSGKSTLLARLAYLGITQRLPYTLRGHVPVLVEAVDYTGDIVMAIAAALRDRAGVDIGDDRDSAIDFLQAGRFLILFDGLSEVFGDQQQAVREIVRTATSTALRTCSIVVATRQITGNLLNARTIELEPLTGTVIESLLSHQKLTDAAKNRLRLQISSFADHKIEPLLFMMMLQASGEGELARSRSMLYERYFRTQLKVRANDEWLGWSDALEALAARFVLPSGRRGFGMTHAQLIDFLDGRRDGNPADESTVSRLRRMYHLDAGDALELLNSLANSRVLIRDRRIRFAHDTFEEYFVARAIVSRHAEGTWSPPEWFYDSQHTRELANVARFIDEMTDENPLANILAVQLTSSDSAATSSGGWRFDEPAFKQFWVVDDDVQQFMQVVRPALERAFLEILADPLSNPRVVIRGEVIHIKRLASLVLQEQVVPPLLLTYAVKKRDRLIGVRSLCRAADVTGGAMGSEDERVHVALERMLDAMNNAKINH